MRLGINDALAQSGRRVTGPRQALVELIGEQRGHFTAADLMAEARREQHQSWASDGLSHARSADRDRGTRAARPAIRRARLRRLRAGAASPPRDLPELRQIDRGRGQRPAVGRALRSRSGAATGSTAIGSSCMGCVPACQTGARVIWLAGGAALHLDAARRVGRVPVATPTARGHGLAAGILVATALVDLLPEAIELIGGESAALLAGAAAVVGYLIYAGVETFIHQGSYEHGHEPGTRSRRATRTRGEPRRRRSSAGSRRPA